MADASKKDVDLKQQFEKEKNDPAMVAYLKSLGIDPNYVPPKNDPRRVVISEFQIVFKEGHAPIGFKFATEEDVKAAKNKCLVVKEKAEFRIKVTFRVQHNVLPGFKIQNKVSKMGKTLAEDEEQLGSYPPSNDFKSVEIPRNDWNDAPEGFLARGEYKSKLRFVDDDGKCHMEFEYTLKVAKDWE